MASISLTIPDDKLSRVVDALCLYGGYVDTDGNKGAFAKATAAKIIRQVVKDTEQQKAFEVAMAAVVPAEEITIT